VSHWGGVSHFRLQILQQPRVPSSAKRGAHLPVQAPVEGLVLEMTQE
jgi:hypothetical protein